MKKIILALYLFTPVIFAEPSLEEIQSIKISDIQKINSWMLDKKTKPRFKVMILEKLNILLLENPEELIANKDQLFSLFRNINRNHKDKGSSYNYLLRKKNCLLLSQFKGTEKENDSYEQIKENILTEDNGEVAASCIQMSSSYENKKDETNKLLVKMLEPTLKKKRVNEEEIEIASAIIDVLDKFKKKQSYLPLLKVLESAYPGEIKNKAKKTLETLSP